MHVMGEIEPKMHYAHPATCVRRDRERGGGVMRATGKLAPAPPPSPLCDVALVLTTFWRNKNQRAPPKPSLFASQRALRAERRKREMGVVGGLSGGASGVQGSGFSLHRPGSRV